MLAALFLASILVVYGSNNFVTVRQNANRLGIIDMINSNTGDIVRESSSATITFAWPYIEMTSDEGTGKIFISTFPDNSTGPALYELNARLEVLNAWTETDYSFFDMQYSPKQDTLYGIKVTTTYGRVLSNFSAVHGQKTVAATELFTLPYMWYVNASSFHADTNRYFALINYFPGHPESVLDQQLVICDFTSSAACKIVLIDSSFGILHFISFSTNQKLYFTSKAADTVYVGELDINTGKVSALWSIVAAEVGPLTVQDVSSKMSVFIKPTMSSAWELYTVSFDGQAKRIRAYTPTSAFTIFSAATRF